MTTATVDSQAKKSDEAWTPQEEDELVKLVGQEDYRRSRLGDTTTKWAPIARHFSRTVKAVKRKYDKLQNPDKGERCCSVRCCMGGGEREKGCSLSSGWGLEPTGGGLARRPWFL